MIIKAFIATRHPELCELYAKGHEKVLEDYGVPVVASADRSWFNNDDVIGIIVMNNEQTVAYGGAKIHMTNKRFPLPFESALEKIDSQVETLIPAERRDGFEGELCGLWNSKEVAGTGLSAIITKACVAKAGVVIANRLQLERLWVLCASYTTGLVIPFGFRPQLNVGEQGMFEYPTEDYIAVLMNLEDPRELSHADAAIRTGILSLRLNPQQKMNEQGKTGPIEISYDLDVENN